MVNKSDLEKKKFKRTVISIILAFLLLGIGMVAGSTIIGLDKTIRFTDGEGNLHELTFQQGVLTSYNKIMDYQGSLGEIINPSVFDGIVSYYKLNETSGEVIDSANLNNGINNGATRGVVGIIDNAFDFESSNHEYVSINDGGNLSFNNDIENYSMGLWFKTESKGVNKELIIDRTNSGSPASYRCNINIIDQVHCGSWDGQMAIDTYTSTLVSSDNWHYLTFVSNITHSKIYLDGNLEDTKINNNGDTSNLEGSYIGRYSSGDQDIHYFDGEIDEVGIWDRALSNNEIQRLYNNGNGLSYF